MGFKKTLSFDRSQLLSAANFFSKEKGTVLLFSGGQLDSSQHSILALFPYETITLREGKAIITKGDITETAVTDNPWDALEDFFSLHQSDYLFGFLGYEMGAFSDPHSHHLYQPSFTPDAYWQRCALVLYVDHEKDKAEVSIELDAFPLLPRHQQKWLDQLKNKEGWLSLFSVNPVTTEALAVQDQPNRKSKYLSKIELVKEYIRNGDVYQANIAQEFVFKGRRDPFQVFSKLVELNPAPFSAYFHLSNYTIVSTSPERFLKKQGDILETRPIKGTINRGKNPQEDALNKKKLLESEKERAELLMITDLMRNDLGKVSQIGTVEVLDLNRCEGYTNVFHLISVIQSKALEDLSTLSLIKHCFPAGSITGCPKLRSMEVIKEIEQCPRGIYTGSIGYVKGKDFDLNVAIRTLLFTDESVSVKLGAGIVIDSIPEDEFQETLYKGEILLNVLNKEGQM